MAHSPLLLTRPLAQSRRFAEDVAARMGEGPVIFAPLIEIVHREPPDLTGYQGVILTSAQGLPPRTAWPAGMVAWCVGARTAEAARAVGLDARSADGALPDLLAMIRSAAPTGPLLYLHGEYVSGEVAPPLRAAGITTDSLMVYEQRSKALTNEALGLLQTSQQVLIPVFSRRSAQLLVPWLVNARAKLVLAAISPAVAEALAVQSAATIGVADRPESDAMLDLLCKLEPGLRA